MLAGNYHIDSGYELTRRLLAGSRSRRPTAILCGNDRMALGCLLGLLDGGLRVPEDVSVVGYDDQQGVAAELRPALTTIQLPYYTMGRWAAERVFAGGLEGLPARTRLPCPLILRDSVAPPRGSARSGNRAREATRPAGRNATSACGSGTQRRLLTSAICRPICHLPELVIKWR